MDDEQRVREALRRAATYVQPAADGWERLERARRSRRRRERLVGAGSALALLALVGVTLVALRPDGARTELTSPPPASPPPPPASPPPATATGPAGPPEPLSVPPVLPAGEDHMALLATAGGGHVLTALPFAGAAEIGPPSEVLLENVCQQDCGPQVLRTRPGSRAGEVTAVRAAGGRCQVERDSGVVTVIEGACESPVWSPDGDRLAWLDRSGSELMLTVARWDEATASVTVLGSPLPLSADLGLEVPPHVLELQYWTAGSSLVQGGGGNLLTVASGSGGQAQRGALPLRLLDDGTYQVAAVESASGPVIALDQDGELEVSVVADLGVAPFAAAELVSRRRGLELPSELADPRAAGRETVWVAVAGRDVLVGDGVDQVWWTRLTDDGFAPLEELLPGAYAITAGDLVLPGLSTPEPSPPVETSPTATPTMEEIVPRETEVGVFFGIAGPSCEEVERFPRLVDSPAVARGALEALLAGPTAEEAAAGAFFGLPPQPPRTVRSARIEDGTAHVDFGPLQRSASGAETTSCGSAQLLASLDATLTQFPTIDRARYSIEGSEEAFYAFAGERAPPR